MTEEKYYNEIYRRYGSIKRARGPFLYTAKGIRLTDLYQEAGRAILGWGGKSAFTMLKNALERGATGSFVTDFTYRLKKAVSTLLDSKREIYVYSTLEDAQKTDAKFYRPWFDDIQYREEKAVILEPPLPWTKGIFILAVSPDMAKDEFEKDSIRLPSPIEAACARSIYNLISAIQERQEKEWFIYDTILTKYWTRKGPYLFPKMSENEYDSFVEKCLDLGIAISPDYSIPSIVPYGADKGVFTKLKESK